MINLIHGDCLEEIKKIPDGSIDLILTDPPYGISYQSNMRVKTKKFDVLENDSGDMRLNCYDEFYRILNDNTACLVFCSYKNFAKDMIKLEQIFTIKNVIIWSKGGGGIGDLKHSLSTDYEICIVAHKGKCKIRGKRIGSVWSYKKVNPSKMVHATEKPVNLLSDLMLKFSDSGCVVFDPFMGSGSTGLACVNTNRKFIGIELDKNYFDIAENRLNEHRKNLIPA